MILDNSTTGMTGHQDHAATEKPCRAILHLRSVSRESAAPWELKMCTRFNAFDLPLLEKTIKEETAKDGFPLSLQRLRAFFLTRKKAALQSAPGQM